MTKFNIGDKVVPISKTVDWNTLNRAKDHLDESSVWNRALSNEQTFLYVNSIDKFRNLYTCSNERGGGGDYFHESDLTPYKTKQTKNQRITALENEVAELRPLKQEVAELKLIVHELRERPQLTTVINNAPQEPSATNTVEDIIEFEGKQYRKVDRKAQVGDVVIFRINDTDSHHSTTNKPYKVTTEYNGHPRFIGDSGSDYSVYTHDHNRTPETVDVYELIESKPLTPNQQRASIIDKAKAFVKNIVGEYDTFNTTVGRYKDQCVRPIFHVNEKKRAITVLIYGAFGKELIFKGLAKCVPNDVFNEHIGKAIALGRALNLDVSEFEQVVQPTEFEVGQVVKENRTNSYIKPFEISSIEKTYSGITKLVDEDETWIGGYGCVIINDTNAIY